MRKMMLVLLALLFTLPLAACGGSAKTTIRDFYSMKKDPPGTPEGTMWLGMTRPEVDAAVGFFNDASEVRVRYADEKLASATSVTHYIHPIGISWDMSADEIKAYYAKDPAVTVTQEPNLLTAAKTIDGTVYYVRIVFYGDGSVKETNIANDPSLDELLIPNQ